MQEVEESCRVKITAAVFSRRFCSPSSKAASIFILAMKSHPCFSHYYEIPLRSPTSAGLNLTGSFMANLCLSFPGAAASSTGCRREGLNHFHVWSAWSVWRRRRDAAFMWSRRLVCLMCDCCRCWPLFSLSLSLLRLQIPQPLSVT